MLAPHANTELGNLIDGAPDLVVVGERLNVGLLRRFYARHGFEPVGTTRQAQANSLVNAVLRGADLLLQVRCAVYTGTLGAGFGRRFDRIGNADLAVVKAA